MFRLTRDNTQRIPVLWIPSTSRTIPVATVSRRDISVDVDDLDLEGIPSEGCDRFFILDDTILMKGE